MFPEKVLICRVSVETDRDSYHSALWASHEIRRVIDVSTRLASR